MPERSPSAAKGRHNARECWCGINHGYEDDHTQRVARKYRYKLVIEGDDYKLLSALSEVAQVALRVPPGRTVGVEGVVEWTSRSDEEVGGGR